MSFNPPDYYNAGDYPLVKKRERKKMPRLYGLEVGDRIELEFIDMSDDDTDLRPGDKGVVREIDKKTTDYNIHVTWDNRPDSSRNRLLIASEDKWKILKHAK